MDLLFSLYEPVAFLLIHSKSRVYVLDGDVTNLFYCFILNECNTLIGLIELNLAFKLDVNTLYKVGY